MSNGSDLENCAQPSALVNGELALTSSAIQAFEPPALEDEDELSEGGADFDASPSEDELGDDVAWVNGDLRQRRQPLELMPAPTSGRQFSDWILPPRSFR